MSISWNEIRHNAIKFSSEWKGARCERADSQTFWNEFLQVFGIKRRVVASFEEPARRISGTYGFIDMFWRGVLIVEQKSFGEDLGAHYTSKRDILKVARSLFLGELRAEFEARKPDRSTGRKARLEEFHKNIYDHVRNLMQEMNWQLLTQRVRG